MYEKLNLREDSIVFYVDIEKGTVVAVMEKPQTEALGFLKKVNMIDKEKILMFHGENIFYKIFSAPIRAKATCSEEDDFDLEYGMELAKNRCLAKYYKKVTRFFVEMNNLLDPVLNTVEDYMLSCAEKYNRFLEKGKIDN